jgi:hypothetical protein
MTEIVTKRAMMARKPAIWNDAEIPSASTLCPQGGGSCPVRWIWALLGRVWGGDELRELLLELLPARRAETVTRTDKLLGAATAKPPQPFRSS